MEILLCSSRKWRTLRCYQRNSSRKWRTLKCYQLSSWYNHNLLFFCFFILHNSTVWLFHTSADGWRRRRSRLAHATTYQTRPARDSMWAHWCRSQLIVIKICLNRSKPQMTIYSGGRPPWIIHNSMLPILSLNSWNSNSATGATGATWRQSSLCLSHGFA